MANTSLTDASIGSESSEPPVAMAPPAALELPHAVEPAGMEETSAFSIEDNGTKPGALDVRADAPDGALTEPRATGEDIIVEAADGAEADGAAEEADGAGAGGAAQAWTRRVRRAERRRQTGPVGRSWLRRRTGRVKR